MMADIEENKNVVRRFFQLSAEGDMDGCFDLLHDDLTWTNIGSTRFSGTFRGREAVLQDLVGPLFGALSAGILNSLEQLIAEGDEVVVLSRGEAQTLDGQPYNNSYAQVFTVREGQIFAVREYMDTALVDRVFGAVE